ncbi:hypothetical protein POX_b02931 [Penicillium oxalicum]|nr:hypothetical protein POX_b02931 [Penicillium oxalicum]KAI2792887.1 hypothetical protein POX_b02931 [Penicillium oxalicum]
MDSVKGKVGTLTSDIATGCGYEASSHPLVNEIDMFKESFMSRLKV